jgi:hypothetical protein
MITLDQALDVVMQLEYEQKELLLDILRKRQIEERREEEAIRAFQAGELKTETADELLNRLHASLETTDDGVISPRYSDGQMAPTIR